MNCTPEKTNGQNLYETFDSTDEGLREAWSLFLARYRWDCMGTYTFKNARRDPFELVNAVNLHLQKWHEIEAMANGSLQKEIKPRQDAYGRELAPRIKRKGSWWNRWRKGIGRPITVMGIEPHQSGDLHVHTLIKFQTPWFMHHVVGWRTWSDEEYANSMKMGWSRFETPKSQGDVAGYCSKYVTKGGELVLSPSFNARCVQSPSLTNAPEAA